jgi:hypothetical protein
MAYSNTKETLSYYKLLVFQMLPDCEILPDSSIELMRLAKKQHCKGERFMVDSSIQMAAFAIFFLIRRPTLAHYCLFISSWSLWCLVTSSHQPKNTAD